MILQAEPTEIFAELDGVECRVWNAVTEKHTQCFLFVHQIAIPDDADESEFTKMLPRVHPLSTVLKRLNETGAMTVLDEDLR